MGCCEVLVNEPLQKQLIDTVIQTVTPQACIHFLGVEHGYFIGDQKKYEKDCEKYPDGWLLYGYHPEIPVYSFDLSYDRVDQITTLQEVLSDLCVLNPHGPHPSCDVTIAGFDKGDAILQVAERLGVPPENTYAFGDGKNDIEMLSTVGCGIAMGNACNEVKSCANKVTDTVNNDGVAVGIENYILC